MPAAPLGKSTLFGCPISGEVAPVSQCPDPTFAQEILGPGVVIFPEGCELFGWSLPFPPSTPWAWARQRA